jgi:hypothetical protein
MRDNMKKILMLTLMILTLVGSSESRVTHKHHKNKITAILPVKSSPRMMATQTLINPNTQIGGPLVSTNNMLPGVASDNADGITVSGKVTTPNLSVSNLTGYVYANGSSNSTASTTIPNTGLANSATTVNGQTCTLGSTCTVTSTASNNLTLTDGASSTKTYDGSSAQTLNYISSSETSAQSMDGELIIPSLIINTDPTSSSTPYVTAGPQSTVPTSWTFDWTTPALALSSINGISSTLATNQTMSGTLTGAGYIGPITGTVTGTTSLATNLTGTVVNSIPYQSASATTGYVAPNTTTTPKVLSMTGDGTNGATPVYSSFIDPSLTTTQTMSGSLYTPTLSAATVLPQMLGTVYYADGYPTSCTVGGVSYTTQLDCAWYTALSAISGDTSVVVEVGQNTYTSCAGLQMKPSAATGRGVVNLIGASPVASHIELSCSNSNGLLYLPTVSGEYATQPTIKQVTLDAQHLSPYAINLQGQTHHITMSHVWGANGTTAQMLFGTATGVATSYDSQFEDLEVYENCPITGGCGTGAMVTGYGTGGAPTLGYGVVLASQVLGTDYAGDTLTCTVSGGTYNVQATCLAAYSSGGLYYRITSPGNYDFASAVPTISVTGYTSGSGSSATLASFGGSNYDSNTEIVGTVGSQNATSNVPCTTVGTYTPTIVSGVITGMTTTDTGCTGLYSVSIYDLGLSQYGIDDEYTTDSRWIGITGNTGSMASMRFQRGDNKIYGAHPEGQGQNGIINGPQYNEYYGTNCGEQFSDCISNYGNAIVSGGLFYINTSFIRYAFGYTLYRNESSSAVTTASDTQCSITQPMEYHTFSSPSGIIDQFGSTTFSQIGKSTLRNVYYCGLSGYGPVTVTVSPEVMAEDHPSWPNYQNGSGVSTANYYGASGNRADFGYNGSNAVVAASSGHGIKFGVGAAYGSLDGTWVGGFDQYGSFCVGGTSETYCNYNPFYINSSGDESTNSITTRNVTLSALTTPVTSTLTTATTGGTLAASTSYCYRVSAFNSLGSTIPSTESCLTTGSTTSTNTVTIPWSAVLGAASYSIYGRTTSAELLLASGVTALTYTDTGSLTPSGAMPTTNTTIGAINGLSSLILNSTTSPYQPYIYYAANGTDYWKTALSGVAGNYRLYDVINAINRLDFAPNGSTSISSGAGSYAVQINNATNSGTGGLAVYSGGSTSTKVASIDGSGDFSNPKGIAIPYTANGYTGTSTSKVTLSDTPTFTNNVTLSALTTPTTSTLTTATTGGTLTASTSYCYRVNAVNSIGSTIPSTESCLTTGSTTSTNTITIPWSTISGATSYSIYGRTTSAELLLASGITALTYTDTGSLTPSGAMPTTNTTLGSIYTGSSTSGDLASYSGTSGKIVDSGVSSTTPSFTAVTGLSNLTLNSTVSPFQSYLYYAANGTNYWQTLLTGVAGNYRLYDPVNSLIRMEYAPNSTTRINAGVGSSNVQINSTTGSGTGGLAVYSGGSTSTYVGAIDGSGNFINANGTVIPSTATGNTGVSTGKLSLVPGSEDFGYATLTSGTVTVSDTLTCTPSATCIYKLTRCAVNSSTVIGELSIGTVTSGTSFVINSLTAANIVATGDLSSVCWQIN